MPPKLPLPRGWKRRVKSAILHGHRGGLAGRDDLCRGTSTWWNSEPSHGARGPLHLLQITRLEEVFETYRSEKEALRSF